MTTSPRRAAVLGGNRIPFARQFGAYAEASNQDMLTAALDGLVARYHLGGEQVGEVVAGAVIKHSRDFNLTRESVLGSALSPSTPAYDIQQACGTGLEAAILVSNKIKLGQIESGIAGGVDTSSDAPIAVSEKLRKKLLKVNRAKGAKNQLLALSDLRPTDFGIASPGNTEPRTGLSMGEHMAQTAKTWGITREAQDELAVASHRNLAASYERGFQDDLVTSFKGLAKDANLRPDSSMEKLATLKPAFGKGNIRGVAAPESANNAGAQTSFIPLLTLGIPPNAVMALMVGAMTIHNIQPGPQVITANPQLFWGLIASMWVGNLMLVILNLPLIGMWVQLLKIPYRLLYPMILVFCCIGVYTVNNTTFDVWIIAVLGVVGYIFAKLECEAAPLLLGFILGPMMEENLRRALLLSRGSPSVFIERPISATMLVLSLILLIILAMPAIRKKRDETFVED